MGAANDAATAFTKMIEADRQKKKHELLANQMLGSAGRRSSMPGAGVGRKTPFGPGATLASRVGITKRSSSVTPKPAIDGQWTHDLHQANSQQKSRPSHLSRTASASQGNRLHASIQQAWKNGASGQVNIRGSSTAQMSIRGMAANGPYVVVASNFASGTTAADIEAAMVPVGGPCLSCHLLSSNPTVMAELVFEERDGAENVIATFNNQRADGRLLYVYMKAGGPSPRHIPSQAKAASPNQEQEAETVPQQKAPAQQPIQVHAPREERDLMEVDDGPKPIDSGRLSREPRADERRRGGASYQDDRYGPGDPYEPRRDGRDYRRDREPRPLYSDGMYRQDPRYRR